MLNDWRMRAIKLRDFLLIRKAPKLSAYSICTHLNLFLLLLLLPLLAAASESSGRTTSSSRGERLFGDFLSYLSLRFWISKI